MTHTVHSTQDPHHTAGGLAQVIDTDAIRAMLQQNFDLPLREQVQTLCNGYDALLEEHRHQHEYLMSTRNHLVQVQQIVERWVAEEEA